MPNDQRAELQAAIRHMLQANEREHMARVFAESLEGDVSAVGELARAQLTEKYQVTDGCISEVVDLLHTHREN